MRHALIRAAFAFLLAFGWFAARAPSAHAAGSVTVSNRAPTEDDKRWKLKFTIDNGTPPVLPHMSMLFVFTPKVLYERALTDKTGDKPILNKIPLQNQQAITESLDVGFSDGTGKVFSKTQFDFVIRRDRGFEAGEYELKIKREGDGVQIGQTMHLVLNGDNEIVDRRAITFAGEKKKKPEEKAAPAEEKKEEPAPEAKAEEPPAAGDGPPPVPPKQGGCGCLVASDVDGTPAWAALAALGLALAARRRRT